MHALRAAWYELLALCKHINITIGEMNPPPEGTPYPYTYLGMTFALQDEIPHVQLAEKSKAKLLKAAALIDNRLEITVADALALFGQTVWACTVTGFELSALYYVLKFIRRTQKKNLSATVKIWPSIIDIWKKSLIQMTTRSFVADFLATRSMVMYTDASDSGWGVVIVENTPNKIHILGQRWSTKESCAHINILELKALLIGIRTIKRITQNQAVTVDAYIDNTSALAWAKRKRAANWTANQLAAEVQAELKVGNVALRGIAYVASAQNPADEPSRRYSNNALPTQLSSDTEGYSRTGAGSGKLQSSASPSS